MMTNFLIKSNLQSSNKVVTSHQNVFDSESLWSLKPKILVSSTGATKDISGPIFIREKLAANSAVAGTDVMINNFFIAQANKSPESTINIFSDIPRTDQGSQGICFLMPFLNMIQSQLNFPMDYNKFLECLDPKQIDHKDDYELPIDNYDKLDDDIKDRVIKVCEADKQYNIDNPDDPVDRDCDYHKKIATLLYSGACFPVYESISRNQLCGKSDARETISDPINQKCSKCPKTYIKIQILDSLDRLIKSYKDLCDILHKEGPKYVGLEGILYLKFYLLHINNKTNFNEYDGMSETELLELIPAPMRERLLKQSKTGHAVTLTDCEGPDQDNNYTFTLRNSWGSVLDSIQITRKDFDKKTADTQDLLVGLIDSVAGFEPWAQTLKVIECSEINTNCNQQEKCKELGYDKVKDIVVDNECPCGCDTVVNNLNITVTKIYASHIGDKSYCDCPINVCPKNYILKHLPNDKCDCIPDPGTWCMPNNECMDGNYEEYLLLINQGARDWKSVVDNGFVSVVCHEPLNSFEIKRDCSAIITPPPPPTNPVSSSSSSSSSVNVSNSSSSASVPTVSSSSVNSTSVSSSSVSSNPVTGSSVSSSSSSSSSVSSSSSSSTSSSSTSSSSTAITPTPTPTPTECPLPDDPHPYGVMFFANCKEPPQCVECIHRGQAIENTKVTWDEEECKCKCEFLMSCEEVAADINEPLGLYVQDNKLCGCNCPEEEVKAYCESRGLNYISEYEEFGIFGGCRCDCNSANLSIKEQECPKGYLNASTNPSGTGVGPWIKLWDEFRCFCNCEDINPNTGELRYPACNEKQERGPLCECKCKEEFIIQDCPVLPDGRFGIFNDNTCECEYPCGVGVTPSYCQQNPGSPKYIWCDDSISCGDSLIIGPCKWDIEGNFLGKDCLCPPGTSPCGVHPFTPDLPQTCCPDGSYCSGDECIEGSPSSSQGCDPAPICPEGYGYNPLTCRCFACKYDDAPVCYPPGQTYDPNTCECCPADTVYSPEQSKCICKDIERYIPNTSECCPSDMKYSPEQSQCICKNSEFIFDEYQNRCVASYSSIGACCIPLTSGTSECFDNKTLLGCQNIYLSLIEEDEKGTYIIDDQTGEIINIPGTISWLRDYTFSYYPNTSCLSPLFGTLISCPPPQPAPPTPTPTPTQTPTLTPTQTPTTQIINQSIIINNVNNEVISRITVN